MLADGPVARLDVSASAPAPEPPAVELLALVRDDVLGAGLRLANGAAEERADLMRSRSCREDREAHDET